MAELQRRVELLEQCANDQVAELETLRASKKKQGRLIRATWPLNRGREQGRLMRDIRSWNRGRAGATARKKSNRRRTFALKLPPEPPLPSTSFKF